MARTPGGPEGPRKSTKKVDDPPVVKPEEETALAAALLNAKPLTGKSARRAENAKTPPAERPKAAPRKKSGEEKPLTIDDMEEALINASKAEVANHAAKEKARLLAEEAREVERRVVRKREFVERKTRVEERADRTAANEMDYASALNTITEEALAEQQAEQFENAKKNALPGAVSKLKAAAGGRRLLADSEKALQKAKEARRTVKSREDRDAIDSTIAEIETGIAVLQRKQNVTQSRQGATIARGISDLRSGNRRARAAEVTPSAEEEVSPAQEVEEASPIVEEAPTEPTETHTAEASTPDVVAAPEAPSASEALVSSKSEAAIHAALDQASAAEATRTPEQRLKDELADLAKAYSAGEKTPNSTAEYKAKLSALLDKYEPRDTDLDSVWTSHIKDPQLETAASQEKAPERDPDLENVWTSYINDPQVGGKENAESVQAVKDRLAAVSSTPPVAPPTPSVTKADLEAEAKHREEYYKAALHASQKPRGLWQNLGALVGIGRKNYDPVGNIARLKQGAEAARAAATSGNPEGIALAARPEATTSRTPDALAGAALAAGSLALDAKQGGMDKQSQESVDTLVDRNAKQQKKKKGLLFYGLLGAGILGAIGGVGTAVKYGLDHQGTRQPVAAGGRDVGPRADGPNSSSARPEALQAAPGQHHHESVATAQHEAAHAAQAETLQKAPSGISVEVNAAGEGADRLYARMREGMLNRYGITLEGAPPLIGLLTNYSSPDAFSTAFGFERYPLSAVMHREGDGRTADMFVISSDGRTFTYVDSRGERHLLAETSATGEVILHPLSKIPMQNYTVRRSVSHIANVAPRTIARPLTAPTPPQVAPPRAEAPAATPVAPVTPPPPDVPPRPNGPVGQLLQ